MVMASLMNRHLLLAYRIVLKMVSTWGRRHVRAGARPSNSRSSSVSRATLHFDTIVLSVCLNDLVPFRWARFGDGKYDMVMSEANSLSVALELLPLRLRLRFHALSPLLTQDDATLLAWDSGRWQSYTQDVLLPFVVARDPPPVVVMVLPSLAQFEALERGGCGTKCCFHSGKWKGSACSTGFSMSTSWQVLNTWTRQPVIGTTFISARLDTNWWRNNSGRPSNSRYHSRLRDRRETGAIGAATDDWCVAT